MLVVADSSPFIVLINIGCIDILPRLFGKVLIPPEVSAELAQDNRPQIVRAFIAKPPEWLLEKTPSTIEAIPALHAGEIAAISLALEVHADLLFIHESLGAQGCHEPWHSYYRHYRRYRTGGGTELARSEGCLQSN